MMSRILLKRPHYLVVNEVLNNPEVVSYDTEIAILQYGLTDEIEKGTHESEEENEGQEEKHDLIDPQERRRKLTDLAS